MGIWDRRTEVNRFIVVAPSLESFFVQMKMLLPKLLEWELRAPQVWSARREPFLSSRGAYLECI